MSQSEEELTYTAGEVAQAIGVRLATLRTWVERGYLPSVQSQAREWRRFGKNDVAYAAAFALVAKPFGASSAATIMEDATSQRALWCKGVDAAFQSASGMRILAKQYRYNDVLTTEAELNLGEGLDPHGNAFGDMTRKGAVLGDEELEAEPPDVVADLRIGLAIRRAAMALARR